MKGLPKIAWSAALPAALIVFSLVVVACVPMRNWSELDSYAGVELYETFCASCHGRKGRGDGPVAPLLKVHVPDLTLIAARHGGKFPEEHVYSYIDGQADSPIHGPRNMPVWGYEFYGEQDDDEVAHAQATRTIDRLVRYVRSIQRTR